MNRPIWRKLADAAAYQIKHGWIPALAAIFVTLALLKAGMIVTGLLVVAVVIGLWARKYRVTVRGD